MARGDLTPQEIELRKIISNNINSLLDIKNKKQIDVHNATKIPKSTLTGLNIFLQTKKAVQSLDCKAFCIIS